MVQNAPHCITPLPLPMSQRIRLTITVLPEVHAIFQRMSEASGVSLGKCMGDWLADTAEGAQFVAMKVEEARTAPKTVLREFQAMASGLHSEIGSHIGAMGAGGARSAGGPASSATVSEVLGRIQGKAKAKLPPSSNTGGKSPGKTPPSSPKGSAK